MNTIIKSAYKRVIRTERGEESWHGALLGMVALFAVIGFAIWGGLQESNAQGSDEDGWDAPASVREDIRLESTVLEIATILDSMLSERGSHDKVTEFETVLDTELNLVGRVIISTNIVRATIGSMNQGISEKEADLEWQDGDSITTLMGDKPGEYRIFAYSANSGTYTATNPYVYDSAVEPTILTERFP